MIKLESTKMQKAIERAKAVRPRVRWEGERTYSVASSNKAHLGQVFYIVRFAVINGVKFGECNCAAGERGMVCYHLAAAAQVNVMIQSMRQASTPAAPAPPAPQITRTVEIDRSGQRLVVTRINGWAI